MQAIFCGKPYIYFVAIIVAIGSVFEQSNVTIPLLIVMASILLILNKDITPVMIIFMCLLFAIEPTREYNIDLLNHYLPCFIPLPILVIAIFYHLAKYPSKNGIGKLTIPLVLCSFSMLLGGLLTANDIYINSLVWGALLGIVTLLLYLFFYGNISNSRENNLGTIITETMCAIGLIVTLQFIFWILRLDNIVEDLENKVIFLGWGVSNSLGCVFLLTIPFTLYASTLSRFPLPYYILGAIEIVLIIFTGSRGALMFAIIVVPLAILYTFVISKKRITYALSLIFVMLLLMTFCIKYNDAISNIITNIIEKGFTTTGRIDLYQEAIIHFNNFPLFGSGIGYLSYLKNEMVYLYHSTIFQILGAFGIVGIIAFLIKYYSQFRILLHNHPYCIICVIAFIGYEGYSLLDVMTFTPVPFVYLVLMLYIAAEKLTLTPQTNLMTAMQNVYFKT